MTENTPTDTQTPRTEAFMETLKGYSHSWEHFAQKVEDYAGELEKELSSVRRERDNYKLEASRALDEAHEARQERDLAAKATHYQAMCIHEISAICGIDTSCTIEGLPKAVKALKKRAEDCEDELTSIREVLPADAACLHQETGETVSDYILGLQKEVERTHKTTFDLQNKADMWRDEFARIKALCHGKPLEWLEVAGICDRAMSDIRSNIPLIRQIEEMAARLAELEDEIELKTIAAENARKWEHLSATEVCAGNQAIAEYVSNLEKRLAAANDEMQQALTRQRHTLCAESDALLARIESSKKLYSLTLENQIDAVRKWKKVYSAIQEICRNIPAHVNGEYVWPNISNGEILAIEPVDFKITLSKIKEIAENAL